MRQPPLSHQINIEEHQTHIFNTDWGEGYLVPTLHPKMIAKNFKESTVQYTRADLDLKIYVWQEL